VRAKERLGRASSRAYPNRDTAIPRQTHFTPIGFETGVPAPSRLGRDVLATHCCVASEGDIGIVDRSGAHIAHCPLMNAFRDLIAPANPFRKRGINVALGIDNMFGDYFHVIRSAIMCARIKTQDTVALLSTDVLEMPTIGGARAMGMRRRSVSLEIGKRADLIRLDYRALGLRAVLDPAQNLGAASAAARSALDGFASISTATQDLPCSGAIPLTFPSLRDGPLPLPQGEKVFVYVLTPPAAARGRLMCRPPDRRS
jgi:hypothetical protein